MMEAETVSETLDCNAIFMQLIAREDLLSVAMKALNLIGVNCALHYDFFTNSRLGKSMQKNSHCIWVIFFSIFGTEV
jgi:hypothetical protein